ncbi:MAG: hypothetical protein EA369_00620 [Bradymonadales bacterium]|nr:MAG: hypothetical protein EA369_00620 [Bradymonadales bacterium]
MKHWREKNSNRGGALVFVLLVVGVSALILSQFLTRSDHWSRVSSIFQGVEVDQQVVRAATEAGEAYLAQVAEAAIWLPQDNFSSLQNLDPQAFFQTYLPVAAACRILQMPEDSDFNCQQELVETLVDGDSQFVDLSNFEALRSLLQENEELPYGQTFTFDFQTVFPDSWTPATQIPGFPRNLVLGVNGQEVNEEEIEVRYQFTYLPAQTRWSPVSIQFLAQFQLEVRYGSGQSFQAMSNSGTISMTGMQEPFSRFAIFRQVSLNENGNRFNLWGDFFGDVYVGFGARMWRNTDNVGSMPSPTFHGRFITAERREGVEHLSYASFAHPYKAPVYGTGTTWDESAGGEHISQSPSYIALPQFNARNDLVRLATGIGREQVGQPYSEVENAELRSRLASAAIGPYLDTNVDQNLPPAPGVYVIAPSILATRHFDGGGVYIQSGEQAVEVQMEAIGPRGVLRHQERYESLLPESVRSAISFSHVRCNDRELQVVKIRPESAFSEHEISFEGDTQYEQVAIVSSPVCQESFVAYIPASNSESEPVQPRVEKIRGAFSGVVHNEGSGRLSVKPAGKTAPSIASSTQLTIGSLGQVYFEDLTLTYSDSVFLDPADDKKVIADAWGGYDGTKTCWSRGEGACSKPALPETSETIFGAVSVAGDVIFGNPYAGGAEPSEEERARFANPVLMAFLYAGFEGGYVEPTEDNLDDPMRGLGCSVAGAAVEDGCGVFREQYRVGEELGEFTQLGGYTAHIYRGMGVAGQAGYGFNFRFDERYPDNGSSINPIAFPQGQAFIMVSRVRSTGATLMTEKMIAESGSEGGPDNDLSEIDDQTQYQ